MAHRGHYSERCIIHCVLHGEHMERRPLCPLKRNHLMVVIRHCFIIATVVNKEEEPAPRPSRLPGNLSKPKNGEWGLGETLFPSQVPSAWAQVGSGRV